MSGVFVCHSSPFIPEIGFPTEPEVLFQLDLLASELLESACLCCPKLGSQSHATMLSFLRWALGILNSDFHAYTESTLTYRAISLFSQELLYCTYPKHWVSLLYPNSSFSGDNMLSTHEKMFPICANRQNHVSCIGHLALSSLLDSHRESGRMSLLIAPPSSVSCL